MEIKIFLVSFDSCIWDFYIAAREKFSDGTSSYRSVLLLNPVTEKTCSFLNWNPAYVLHLRSEEALVSKKGLLYSFFSVKLLHLGFEGLGIWYIFLQQSCLNGGSGWVDAYPLFDKTSAVLRFGKWSHSMLFCLQDGGINKMCPNSHPQWVVSCSSGLSCSSYDRVSISFPLLTLLMFKTMFVQ